MVDQRSTAKLPLAEGSVATRCTAAILLSLALFQSVFSLEGTETNAMVLSYLGAASLAAGLLA
jgi:hypothetical protein